MTDYLPSDMTAPGLYLITRQRESAPRGPFDSVRDMASATGLTDYPENGYVAHFDGHHVTGVHSLNPDDLMRPLTDAETEAYLSGHRSYPHAVETEHGVLVPATERR